MKDSYECHFNLNECSEHKDSYGRHFNNNEYCEQERTAWSAFY